MRMKDMVAIVTGSTRGIGLGIAKGFAKEGANLVITSRKEESLTAPAEELRAMGVRVLPLVVDVSKAGDVERMVARTVEEFGKIDVLVNNAGMPMVAPSEELALDKWQQTLDTNLTGSFLCAQAVGRVMLERGSGSIINIASLTSYLGFPMRTAYSVTKSAVLGLTRSLSSEWAPKGVRVNAIAPGWIKTDIMKGLIERGVLDANKLVARTPMGRVGTPEDLAGPAIFLATEDSAFITGQIIPVDGGWLSFNFM
ncbi:MAG TPA: glucose 1-dehydrogenase [Chloroflexota bacterium]